MHPRTTLQSVEKVSCIHSNCSSFLINFSNFVDKTAAVNSRRGIETKFLGVTLVSSIKKQNVSHPCCLPF